MDVYKTEDEQAEAIKKWWVENGKAIVFGVVFGLAAIFGWRQWQAYTINRAEAASAIYQEVFDALAQNKSLEARNPATEIINSYENTGYAPLARLILARLAVDEENYDTAEEHLRKALETLDNESLRHETRLRLARIYIATNKLDQAMSELDISEPGAFAATYEELKGDIYTLRGDLTAAREAYRQALTSASASSTDTSLLNIKLESLGE